MLIRYDFLKPLFNGEGGDEMREFIHDHLLTIMVFAPTAGAFLLLLAPKGRSAGCEAEPRR